MHRRVKEFRVHPERANLEFAPRHAEEPRGHVGAILGDGVALLRHLAYHPAGDGPQCQAFQPLGAPERSWIGRQGKHRRVVMASREQLVPERSFEPRRVQRDPPDGRAGLHYVGANPAQLFPQAGHAHVPECFLVPQDVQREAVADFHASRLQRFDEPVVNLAVGLLPVITGKIARHHVCFHAQPRKVLRQQVFQVTHALRERFR